MSAGHERRLLARARELADLDEIKHDALACLGAARHAGLDPMALAGLTGCAAALGADSLDTYTAGHGWTARHRDEAQFLTNLAGIEDDIGERLHAILMLGRQAGTALDAAREDLDDARDQRTAAGRQLASARALPVYRPCDGCHGTKAAAVDAAHAAVAEAEAAIRDCEARIGICERITRAADALARQLRYALRRIQAVPADLGDTYEAVYRLVRSGGHLPRDGRWITGENETPARA